MSLDIVLTPDEAKGLHARGLDVKVKKNKDGKSVKQLAAEQAESGYKVWRSWDEPGGIRDELYRLAKDNPQLVKLEVLGETYQGREIIAMKLTQGAEESRMARAGRTVQLDAARARVDLHRGQPAADELVHRRLANQ